MPTLFRNIKITETQGHLILLLILILSLGLKLIVWATVLSSNPTQFLAHDSPGYDGPARSLLQTGAFTVSPDTPEIAATWRTPGYPIFLAGMYGLFGEQYAPTILVQIFLSLVTIALIYLIANKLWGPGVASLAALLLAFDVASFSYSLKLLTETFFTLLIVAMLAAGVYLLNNGRRKLWAFLLGLLLALATLVRPISYYLVLVLGLWVVGLGWRRRWRWQTTSVMLILAILPFLFLVGGWQARNYFQTGRAQFSSIEGVNLLFYRGAAIVAVRDGISLKEARHQLGFRNYRDLHPETRSWSEAELSERWKQEGLALILQYPFLFVRTQISGIIRLFVTTGEGTLLRMLDVPIGLTKSIFDFKRLKQPVGFIAFLGALLYLVVVYGGVLYWVGYHLKVRQIALVHLFIWSVLLYFILISAGPETFSRFRVPIMPILVLYAARGLTLFHYRIRVSPGFLTKRKAIRESPASYNKYRAL